MSATHLGTEVEQPIPRVDLSSSEGEPICMRLVYPWLTGDGDSVARRGHEASLPLPEQTGRVRESHDGTTQVSLELPL